jgi:CBS domain-containing protein
MQDIPINTFDSPAAVLELIYKLKVKDVMCKNVYTSSPDQPMYAIQDILKKNSIKGIPIVEGRKIMGIVSMENVLQSLESGTIEDEAFRHMSRKIIALEEDMPVFFAISYFGRYTYRRFPVVNRKNELVGIVTSRDITNRLLAESHTEIERLEKKNADTRGQLPRRIERWFAVNRYDFENAGFASTEIKKILRSKKIDKNTARRIAIAAYELEMNLVTHSNSGSIHFLMDEQRAIIQSEDSGPGIADVDSALQEGYTTATEWIRSLGFGAGLGLPNVNRVSDEFYITSEPSRGTHAKSVIIIEKGAEDESE